jgi:hypothetical protein
MFGTRPTRVQRSSGTASGEPPPSGGERQAISISQWWVRVVSGAVHGPARREDTRGRSSA